MSGRAASMAAATMEPRSMVDCRRIQRAAGDSRHIEKVIEQAAHVLDLTLDDRPCLQPLPLSGLPSLRAIATA